MYALTRPLPLLLLGLLALDSGLARGDEPRKERRVAVARCVSDTGSLLRREAEGRPWQFVARDEKLYSGDLLLFVGDDAALDSANGAVRLAGLGELSGVSTFPVYETAVILHEPGDADLSFCLQRGRVTLTDIKAKGPAHVRGRCGERSAELVLSGPGSRVAVEVYGRWPRGVPFTKEPKPGEGPARAVLVLALKGEVEVRGSRGQFHLHAPPGPALLIGDSLDKTDLTPQRLEKLPAWAEGGEHSEQVKKVQAALRQFRRRAQEKSIEVALNELLNSNDETHRRLAVFLMAALDDLPRLAQALAEAKHADVWDAGVLALRHWIGRGPGQDQKLYQGLIAKRQFTPGEAVIFMNLLHSFGDEDLARPETYEMLIDYLQSDKLGIRGLANWHLYRLVPAGRTIGYDPFAPKEKREQAVRQWRKLIPTGQLPPRAGGGR